MPQYAAIYLRQSLDRYGDELAVTRQREACIKLCNDNGWEPVEYVDNSVSASDRRKDRPGYNRLIEDYERGMFTALVCYDLDRLTRQPRQLEDWIDRAEDRGLRLVTANGEADLRTDGGRMYARIKAAVSRGEVERKGARQRDSHRQRVKSGKPWWPTRPFGFEMNGSHREDEAQALRQIYQGILEGKALTRMAKHLNDAGVPTPKGNQWKGSNLKPVLLNARNAGIYVYNGDEIGQASWEAIVPEDVYRAAVRTLNSPERRTNFGRGGFGRRENLLTGIATCSRCGATVRAAWRRGKDGERSYKTYQCSGKHCVTLPAEWCDSVVTRMVIDQVEVWRDALPEGPSEDGVDLPALRTEEAALVSRKAELGEMFADGLIDRPTLASGAARADARLVELTEVAADHAMRAAGRYVWDPDTLWAWTDDGKGNLDVEKFTPVVKRVCKSITLTGPGKGKKDLYYGQHLIVEFNEGPDTPPAPPSRWTTTVRLGTESP